MDGMISMLVILGLMAAVVLAFRLIVRPPARVSEEDPPGVRSMVLFRGDDAEFRQDDEPDGPLVGIRLFRSLCDGLATAGVVIESRGTLQNAQRAECVVGNERFALVMEWTEDDWIVSVEWVPESAAEKRHVALTHQVFAPVDGPALRRLLSAVDRWLKAHPKLTEIRWHRKERWIAEDTSDPSSRPFDSLADDFAPS
ncbi:MAG: hypothetical protein ACYTG0_22420 [Planctomycetota bacterium]|jgi:hypothetical protein